MSQLLKIFVPAIAIVVLAFYLVGEYNDTRETHAYELAKAELRAEYLERAPVVWSIADADRYDTESRALIKWYFGELGKIYNRFPGHRVAEDRYLQDLEARKGSLRQEVYEGHKASYEQVREIWDLLRDGKYAPELTATQGAMRIDFLEFKPANVGGQQLITGRFVFWGAQRRKVEEKAGNTTQTRVEVQATFPDMQFKLFDAKGKPMAELSFGLPDGSFVPYPELRMEDFPPMAYVGTFSFPTVPFEAATVEIEGGARTRAPSGGELLASYTWKMDVPASWKMGEGQVWENAAHEVREELAPAGSRR